ncbi:MAG: sodium:solute symporter [Planctomycetaceae bacterium]
MPTTHTTDMIVVAAYLLVVTLIGCLMTRKTRSAREFMSAGGSLPGWVVGLSIVGTFVSSISFVANPGKSYSGNWNPFVFSLSLPYAAWIATVFFVPFFRNCGSMSAYEHLEHRFGPWARLYAALFNVMYHVGRIGTILYLVSLAVSKLLELPVPAIIVGLGVLVVVYTLMGGIEAVIWTDVVQSVVLVGGMIVCAVLLVMKVPEGFFGIVRAASSMADNRLSLGSLEVSSRSFTGGTFWTTLVFGLFINVQNFAADQTYVQRYFTANSETAAKRSVWMGAVAYLPISAVLFFLGTGLFIFYQTTGTLPEGTKPDGVLPWFIMHELPDGVSGLLIAAILAAAMSTVDSSLNSSATLLLCDVRNRFLRRSSETESSSAAQDRSELRFLRLSTLGLGVAGVLAALAMIDVETMLEVWWTISGVLSGGTLGLILLARFTSVRGTAATLPATIAGVAGMAAVTLAHQDNAPGFLLPIKEYLSPLMAIVVGTMLVVIVAVVLSPFTSRGGNGVDDSVRGRV